MPQRVLTVAEWIKTTNGFHLKDEAREIARLGDGGWLSIQASRYHYCDPRMDSAPSYRAVEIGAQGVAEGGLEAAAPLLAFRQQRRGVLVYADVPVEMADRYVASRGGIVVGDRGRG